ncbi:MAG: hypothetical protein JO166_19220 [Deltaproteobacteria bacterium]|nr:hypothetical protein [Deltaproteobacteria bacterium]
MKKTRSKAATKQPAQKKPAIKKPSAKPNRKAEGTSALIAVIDTLAAISDELTKTSQQLAHTAEHLAQLPAPAPQLATAPVEPSQPSVGERDDDDDLEVARANGDDE